MLKLTGASLAAISIGTESSHAGLARGSAGVESHSTKPSNVMAIAAHPGDAFFAMGAPVAIATHFGGQGCFLSLSLGEKGSRSIPPAQYGDEQRKAAQKAAAAMGASALFLTYPDGEVPINDEAAFAVCDAIRTHKPATVVTHWKGSMHKDHRACYEIVQSAIFYAGVSGFVRQHPAHQVRTILFADNWEDATGFLADTYLDISPVYQQWIDACSTFPMWRGETGFRYSDYYASRAIACGCLCQCDRAVALMSPADQRIREVKVV